MSVLWMDDPSYYTATLLNTRWTQFSGSGILLQDGTGRFGSQCWRYTGGGNGLTTPTGTLVTGTIGCSFIFEGLTGATPQQLLGFFDGSTAQVVVGLTGTGQLTVWRGVAGGTVLASSSNNLSLGVWYRIEFKATIDPSAGVIEVRVNGSSTGWIPSTGSLNTRNSGTTQFTRVGVFHNQSTVNAGNNCRANDFVFTDTNTPNANFLGDKRCFALYPSSDSSVAWTNNFDAWAASTAKVLNQQIKDGNGNIQRCIVAGTTKSGSPPTWATTGGNTTTDNTVTWQVVGSGANPGAANWMAVSEGIADGDSSYNSSSNPGDIDLFGIASLPAGAQNIAAVDNVIYARKDDAGTRTIASQQKSSGTTHTGANQGLSTSYQFFDDILETDPATSAAWTVSGVNNETVGYKEIA